MRTAPKRSRHRIEILEPAATNAPAIKPETPEIRAESEPGKPSLKADGKANGARPKAAPKMPMWDFLDSDERNADGTVTTIYRLEPVINKLHGQHYIARKPGQLTQEDLLQEFGSGVYDLYVKDANKTLLYRDQLSIHHHAHPPKVDAEEIVAGHPSNAVYFRTWAKKTNANPGAGKSEEEPSKKDDIAEIIRAAREGNKLEPHIIEWIQDFANHRDDLAAKLAQATAQNPTADLAALLNALKGVFPAPQAAAPQVDMLAIIKSLRDLQAEPPDPLAILQQAKEIFTPAQPSVDGLAHFREVFSFARELLGAGGGRRTGWDIGLDYARELGPPILHLIGNAMALRAGGVAPAMAAGAPVAAAAPSAFDPYQNQAAMREHARRMNAAAPAETQPGAQPASGAAPPQQGPPNPSSELATLFAQYGGLVVSAMNNGLGGADFADHLSQLFGTGLVANVSNFGEDALAQMMLSIPEIQVFGELRIRRFTREFLNFEEILDTAEGDEEEPSVPLSGAKRTASSSS
jgi:hypothetical protein